MGKPRIVVLLEEGGLFKGLLSDQGLKAEVYVASYGEDGGTPGVDGYGYDAWGEGRYLTKGEIVVDVSEVNNTINNKEEK